ncbi:MAG: TonB-dependent receptor [Spirosomataceae bacterium]
MEKFFKTNLKTALLLKTVGIPIVLLLVLAVRSYAGGDAPELLKRTVTIQFNNKEIEKALTTVGHKANVRFTYLPGIFPAETKVSLKFKNEPLENVLQQLLAPFNIGYQTNGEFIILKKMDLKPKSATSELKTEALRAIQDITVTGKVSDEKGEALPGVSIILKGTQRGTVTDANGAFSFNVPDRSAILIFSYVGYLQKEVAVGTQTDLSVQLATDNKVLEEVVVVGYGTQKKVNLTGAVSAIKIDDKITGRSLSNVSSGLSGLVPGLAVTQGTGMAGRNGAALLIRGLGTVNNASPLVVVDGMPDVDINRININDIETVSVLKDATSSSVYGSRAANGVILITTKSGKGQEKASINFSGNYAVQVPTKAFDFLADYPRALSLHQQAAAVNTLRSNYTFKDGTIDQWLAMGLIDPVAFPNTDWWNLIMRDGAIQNYNLSASGGGDKSNFFVSVGMMDEKGLQINNDYRRYNARFNYDYKIRKNINTGIKFNGNWSNLVYALEDGFTDDDPTNTAGFDMQYAISGILPYDPVTGYYGGVMAYNEDPQAYNPYTVYQNNLNRMNRQEANANMYLDWSPIPGLTARVDYALNYYNQFRWNANMPNQSYNFQTKALGSRVYVGPNAGVGNFTETGYKTLLNGRLNYNKTIAKNHELGALVVYSEEFWYDRAQNSSRNDRLYPSLHEIDAALTDIQSTGGNSSTEGLRSFIGRVNYTAYDKYLLELNFRSDGSSKFLPGNQYGFFPSAALGWRFTEEAFINEFTNRFLNSGKLRVSYGSLGNNSGVGRYEQQSTLAASNYMIGGSIVKGFVNRKLVNKNLSWENTSVFNVGLDLSFLNNRLSAEIDYYNRLTTGMNRPSDMSLLLTGAYDAPRKNIGNLRNKGIDGNLTWRDRRGEINYLVSINASYNRTKLEQWNEFLSRTSQNSGNQVFIGMPYGFLYTYQDMGIAQTWQDVYNATPQGASPGDILRKDVNGDGRIDDNDKVAYSNIQRLRPTTNFSLNANVGWKGFDLSLLLQGSAGRKDFWINAYNNTSIGAQRYAFNELHLTNPWSTENRNGGWPRLNGNANREETTFWLDNLNYLRVKNLQIGYTPPPSFLKKIGVSNFRLYASTENLKTFTNYRGLDPEMQGNKSDAYPLTKSYSVGINIGI